MTIYCLIIIIIFYICQFTYAHLTHIFLSAFSDGAFMYFH